MRSCSYNYSETLSQFKMQSLEFTEITYILQQGRKLSNVPHVSLRINIKITVHSKLTPVNKKKRDL